MRCSIISTEDKRNFEELKSIILPAASGEMQILPGHAEIFIVLQQGQIILDSEKIVKLSVGAGVCHIKDDDIATIL